MIVEKRVLVTLTLLWILRHQFPIGRSQIRGGPAHPWMVPRLPAKLETLSLRLPIGEILPLAGECVENLRMIGGQSGRYWHDLSISDKPRVLAIDVWRIEVLIREVLLARDPHRNRLIQYLKCRSQVGSFGGRNGGIIFAPNRSPVRHGEISLVDTEPHVHGWRL